MDIGKSEVEILVFLNIGNAKLKVIITPEECERYGIDTSKTDFTRGEIREVMRDVLLRSEEECGFSVTSEKILVQLYPMPSGECELFVTKLTGLTSKERSVLRASDGLSTMETRRSVYRFESRELLILAARAVSRFITECDIYMDEGQRYYVTFEEEVLDGLSECEELSEFGERMKDLPLELLFEYCTKIHKGVKFANINEVSL